MTYVAIFKRIIPFFLTFAAGLLIASIFVPLSAPSFRGFSRGSYKYREYQRVNAENEELKREKCRMKKEIEELRRDAANWEATTLKFVPEVDLNAPAPPPPPRVRRGDR